VSSDFFYGSCLLALLVGFFQSIVIKQAALRLVCFFIVCFSLYTLVDKGFIPPIETLLHGALHPLIQPSLLSLTAIIAIHIQLYSDDYILTTTKALGLARLNKVISALILIPMLSAFVLPDPQLHSSLFTRLHLPSIAMAFIIAAISAVCSLKNHTEQRYLLIAWLCFGCNSILKIVSINNLVDQSKPLIVFIIKDGPAALGLFGIISLTLWVLHYSATLQKNRSRALQEIFDTLADKNRQLEINHARAADLAQNTYTALSQPTQELIASLENLTSIAELRNKTLHLKDNLQETAVNLVLLSQEASKSIPSQSTYFHLVGLLERLPLSFQQRLAQKKVQIILKMSENLTEYAKGDQSLLYKALLLIIEHRLDDLNQAQIHIECVQLNDPRSPKIALEITIQDSGLAYSSSAIDTFWNYSPTLGSHDFKLILASDMIFAMGGNFTISKTATKTNLFIIQISLERASPLQSENLDNTATQHPSFIMPIKCTNVLVIEPEPKTRQLLSNYLKQLGIHSQSVTTIDTAISILIIEPIDLIFISNLLESSTIAQLKKQWQVLDNAASTPFISLHHGPQKPEYQSVINFNSTVPLPFTLDKIRDCLVEVFKT